MKEKTVYALGFFDGVHVGHQALLKACREMADRLGCKAGVLTFLGHPDTLIYGVTPHFINTPQDRRRLLEHYGMDTVEELPFTDQLMKVEWRDFFRMLLEEFHAAGIVCGHDYRFGYLGKGTPDRMQKLCLQAHIPFQMIPAQELDGITVSSTYIRRQFESGDMSTAVRFLGHPHILSGTVISGRQLGRTLGIPTANLAMPQGMIQMKFGVYACRVRIGDRDYMAVTNVGSRPTVGGHRITVEPWILDFDGDLYGKEITLRFYRYLRPEQKFPGLPELKAEIQKNALQVRELFEKS